MKSNLMLLSNHKMKTLSFVNADEVISDDCEKVGPYRAMYDYKYENYVWENFDYKSEPTLSSIREIIGDPDWEEHIYSVIVKEGTTNEEITSIIKYLGYVPDYILERNNNEIKLLHQTDNIKDLIENGYRSEDDLSSYSFGKGLYCLDKDNFEGINDGWINLHNVYTGLYNGEYLRCIEDTDTGGKSGHNNPHEQEILILFDDDKIKWIINDYNY